MKTTWLDIKQSVNRLMFLDATEIDSSTKFPIDNKEAVIEAANYAINEAGKYFPYLEQYEIIQPQSSEEGFNEYDLQELTKQDGNITYLGFVSVLKADNVSAWMTPASSKMLLDRYLYLKKSEAGTYKVIYKKYFTKITESTENDFVMEIEPQAANLLPLLMTYRIYKDDDPVKAAQYYNEYIAARDELAALKAAKETHDIEINEGEYDVLSYDFA